MRAGKSDLQGFLAVSRRLEQNLNYHLLRPEEINLLDPNIQKTGATVVEKPRAAAPGRGLETFPPTKFLGVDRDTLLKRFFPWIKKGGYAILDQGLISGSNFLVSILLARWLVPEQYGAYAVAFGIFVLLWLVYQSLVLEPMAVFGGSAYRNSLRGYLRSLLWIQVAISLAVAVALGLSALVAGRTAHSAGLAGALAGIMIASPCIMFNFLVRRSFYLELSPAKSVLGALVYTSLSLSLLVVIYRRGLLSAFSAFLLIGIAALLTGFYQLVRLRAQLPPSTFIPPVGETWRRHWRYGRWALATAAAGWIPAYIYYPLLSSFGNMAHSGQLKALMNLTLPVEQTKAALSLLFLPYAASVQAREGASGAGALSLRLTLVSLGVALAYWTFVLPIPGTLFRFLYSGRYAEVAHLLPIVAFGSIIWSAASGPAIVLRAMESPASVFKAFSVATGVSLLVGIPATWKFGLTGAIWGTNLADVLSLVLVVLVLRRKIASPADGSEGAFAMKGVSPRVMPGPSTAD
jgi:O-antigen/teichoic acid export membrane protein